MAAASRRSNSTEQMDAKVRKAILGQITGDLKDFGVTQSSIVIEPREDHDGDPVVFITITHALKVEPLDLQAIRSADSRLRDLAWSMGEKRFIHIRHQYDDKQRLSRAA